MDEKKLIALVEQLCEFDSALLANTLEYVDPTPPHEVYVGGDIGSIIPTLGVAVTCQIDTSTPGGSTVLDPY